MRISREKIKSFEWISECRKAGSAGSLMLCDFVGDASESKDAVKAQNQKRGFSNSFWHAPSTLIGQQRTLTRALPLPLGGI